MERGSLLAGLEFILRIMSFGWLGTFATVAVISVEAVSWRGGYDFELVRQLRTIIFSVFSSYDWSKSPLHRVSNVKSFFRFDFCWRPWLIHGPVRSPKERFLEKLRFRCNPGVTIIDMVFKELVFHRDTFRLVRYWLHLTSDCWSCGYQFKTAGTYKILTTRLSSLQFDDGLG